MKQWKEKAFWNHNKWFHATTMVAYDSIMSYGIVASINRQNPLDYGWGFYLCPDLEWSKWFLENEVLTRNGFKANGGIILEYNFRPSDIYEGFKKRFFPRLDEEFAGFIVRNRLDFAESPALCVHDYDILGGPMADGGLTVDFAAYREGLISLEQLYRQIVLPTRDWQLVLHSQTLCDKLEEPKKLHIMKGDGLYAATDTARV